MEKRTPHCKLSVVKTITSKGNVRTTQQARLSAVALGMTFSDMLGFIQGALAMKCPVCGSAELIQDTRDVSHTYKGETSVIASVKGEFCPSCQESLLSAEETDRVMKEMNAFNSFINSAPLNSHT